MDEVSTDGAQEGIDDAVNIFKVTIRVGRFIARLDDGSEREIDRQDVEWEVNLRGLTINKLLGKLREMIPWGSCQEAHLVCRDLVDGGMDRIQYNHELVTAFYARWQGREVFMLADNVELEKSLVCKVSTKSGSQCSVIVDNEDSTTIVQSNVGIVGTVGEQNAYVPNIDWSSIEIAQTGDDMDVPITEENMCILLGISDEIDKNGTEPIAPFPGAASLCEVDEELLEEAAIPVHDHIPEEAEIFYDRDDPKIEKGVKFPSMKDFRMAIWQHAIRKEFNIETLKSDKSRWKGACKSDGCTWTVTARCMADKKTIRVVKINGAHNCLSSSRRPSSMASQAWVAEWSMSIVRNKPTTGTKDLQDKLQEDYNVTIGYDTVWKGKDRAMEELYGSWGETFKFLYNFKAEMEKRSPGSIVEIDVAQVRGKVYFSRFFMALKPALSGFKAGCRPYLSIDSTALNDKWNGHLASCTGLDGHNWMYPVAFGLFDSETEANWTWFMEQLNKALGPLPNLAVCTDACKGLEKAVKTIFPHADQRECFRHLMLNFVKKFHGESVRHMWPAARAYRPEMYDYHMDKVLTACPEVGTYLKNYHGQHWTRSSFNTAVKCDYIHNNLAECFNSWIKGLKDLPVDELADKIREKIMKLFDRRRVVGERLSGRILPAVVQQINNRSRGLGHLKVGRAHHESCEVRDTNNNNLRHVVKIDNQECTCLEWQHTGKPCEHALVFLLEKENLNIHNYVHEYYSLERFKEAYAMPIEPLTDRSQWPKVNLGFDLYPPLAKRSAGRPKKNRFKNWSEPGGSSGNNSKRVPKGTKMGSMNRCKKCGILGHRQSTCPTNGTKKRKRKPKRSTYFTPSTEDASIQAIEAAPIEDAPIKAPLLEAPANLPPISMEDGASEQVHHQELEVQPTVSPPRKKQPTAKKLTPRKMKKKMT